MKKLFLLFLIILLVSCKDEESPSAPPPTLDGNWQFKMVDMNTTKEYLATLRLNAVSGAINGSIIFTDAQFPIIGSYTNSEMRFIFYTQEKYTSGREFTATWEYNGTYDLNTNKIIGMIEGYEIYLGSKYILTRYTCNGWR